MLNKISNTASQVEIETTFNIKFDYSYLYSPKVIIDGMKETSVALVTSSNPELIQFGIWGLLPEAYKDGWKLFQSNQNTLETDITKVEQNEWLMDAMLHRRCLVIATGYFSSVIKNHHLFPFHNSVRNQPIICFAGIFNVLEDGFITFTILSQISNENESEIVSSQPIILHKDHYSAYLGSRFSFFNFENGLYNIDTSERLSYQISKENHKNKEDGVEILKPCINDGFYP